jgi:hypothetical protein
MVVGQQQLQLFSEARKMNKKNDLDEIRIRKIVRETMLDALHETLSHIGFDPKAPQEIQADLHYLRKVRKGSEFMALRVKTSILAILIPTILYLLWQAIKDSINR